MPLNKGNTRVFHRALYGGQLERITLFKRGDDQQQGTVTTLVLHQCRRSQITKAGETVAGDMVADHRCTWHIPSVELHRVGVKYLNPLDRIVDQYNRTWQPEGTTTITTKLWDNHCCLSCVRVDPPGANATTGV